MKILKSQRQELISEYVESNKTATIKEIMNMLDVRDITTSIATVKRDLKDLDLTKSESRISEPVAHNVEHANHSSTSDTAKDLMSSITFTFDKEYGAHCKPYSETYYDVSEFENKVVKEFENEPDDRAIKYSFFYNQAMKGTGQTYNDKFGVQVSVSRGLEIKQESNAAQIYIEILEKRVDLLEKFISQAFPGEFETYNKRRSGSKL